MSKNEIDIVRARQDPPGCQKVLHLNNAGAALMPKQVLYTTTGYLQLEAEMGATTSRNIADDPYLNSLCSARDVGVVEGRPLYYRNDLGGYEAAELSHNAIE